jgi:hypothetical protein
MARTKTSHNNATIQITTTKGVAAYIDKLVSTGLFGTTRAAAAERILATQIQLIIKEALVKKSSAFLKDE